DADHEVHSAYPEEPNFARPTAPNKEGISKFQQANKDSCQREEIFPSYQDLGIDDVEWRSDQRAPNIRSIPPPAAEAFRQAAKKKDDAKVNLKNATPKTQELWIFWSQISESPVERKPIR